MEILYFDVSGKFAHFRKYYANNTALSFSIPPRTTLMGILAGILGLPKDSYYENMASDKIRIGVAVKSSLKKNFHRLNLLSIKSKGDVRKSFDSDFRGINGRVQTPFEIITTQNLITDEVKYRIFVSCYSEGKDTFEKLKNCLIHQNIHYQTSLGIAQFLATVSNYHFISNAIEKTAENNWVTFDSAVIADNVVALDFEDSDLLNFVEEELLPADFKGNFDRELSKMNRVLFSLDNTPLKVKITGNYFEFEAENQKQTIQFLE